MKSIIIYNGKYGATAQYAKWLGEALVLPVLKSNDISGKMLDEFEVFILGSSVYIGKLQIKKWLEQNQLSLGHKKIFFFQVAAAPASEIAKRHEYNKKGIPDILYQQCVFYYLDGRMKM